MRAKMKVTNVKQFKTVDDQITSELLTFKAVGRNESYPQDGSDENNTYAKFTPNAELTIQIQNPNLFNIFEVGQEYYLDFTRAN